MDRRLDGVTKKMADYMPYYTVDGAKPGKDLSEEEYRNIASKLGQ